MAGHLIRVLALAGIALVPAPPAGAEPRAAAEAPRVSPVPPPRPSRAGVPVGVPAGIVAAPPGLRRSPVPPRRPAGAAAAPLAAPSAAALALAPPGRVPVGTPVAPAVDLAVSLALASQPAAVVGAAAPAPPDPAVRVTEGPGALRPPPRGFGSTRFAPPSIATAAAVEAALAALAPLAAPPDPRAVATSPVPEPRTAAARRRFEAAAAALAARPARPPVVPAAQPLPAAPTARGLAEPATGGLCGMAGLEGRHLPRITSTTRGCGIDEPVSLVRVHGVRLSPPATLHCDAARATGRWVGEVAIPAVGGQGGGLVELRLGAHYACRPRNNQRGARLSEHGRGRAIDIVGFRTADGETVTVQRDWGRGAWGRVLRRMRAGACGIFTTTLGPGSDRFHADHFHFDLAAHRSGPYCR